MAGGARRLGRAAGARALGRLNAAGAALLAAGIFGRGARGQTVSIGTPVPPGALQLVVSAQVNGQVAPLSCEGGAARPAVLRVADAFAGERDALALDAGDLVGASAASQLALRWDPNRFAGGLVSTGLRALALGPRDLGAPRESLLRAVGALRGWGVPYVASNLACTGEGAALCAGVVSHGDPPAVLSTSFGRVAVVTALGATTLTALARDRTRGLRLINPAEALSDATRAARRAGAQWVVGVFDPASADPLREALEVAAAVDPTARPDVLLVNDVAGLLTEGVAPRSGLRVVSTRAQQALVIDVGTAVHTSPPILGLASQELALAVEALHAHLCRTEADPLPGGSLEHPLPSDDFVALLLDVLRERTRSEVALASRSMVQAREIFPRTRALRPLDLAAALPFDDEVMVGVLRGTELRGIARSAAARLVLRGVTVEGEVIRVNGRLLEDAARYRVVTTRYVVDTVSGVDALADRFVPAEGLRVREVLRSWLDRPRQGDITIQPVDPAFRTRWVFRANLEAALAATLVNNRGGYTDSQLARAETLALRGDLELRADADHPRYAFENQLRLRYGRTRTVAQDGTDSGFVEGTDLITLRNGYVWRGFRVGPPRWYLPAPYGELYSETEFTRPEGDPPPRLYHHLLVRPTLGVRLQVLEKLSVNVGAGIDWQVLRPEGGPSGVFVFGLQLLQMRLVALGPRWMEAQGSLDIAWREPTGASDVQVRGSGRVSIPLFEPLAITLSYDLFARAANGGPLGLASEATVGLRVNLARAVQAFAH